MCLGQLLHRQSKHSVYLNPFPFAKLGIFFSQQSKWKDSESNPISPSYFWQPLSNMHSTALGYPRVIHPRYFHLCAASKEMQLISLKEKLPSLLVTAHLTKVRLRDHFPYAPFWTKLNARHYFSRMLRNLICYDTTFLWHEALTL